MFVLLVGDRGSYHSAIGEEVFRGFAIADPIAPILVINAQDAKIARAFTLVHELTHIYLGQSGVSGTPDEASESTPIGGIEQFCNDVAGEVLLPSSGLAAVPAGVDREGQEAAARMIQSIALTWSVSEPMVAYRLHRLGRISGATHRALHAAYAARWRELEVVRRTLRDNLLGHTKAARVLGVRSSSVEPLLRRFEMGRDAFAPEVRRWSLLYLLDSNVLIRAHEDYCGLDRVPQFWSWRLDVAEAGEHIAEVGAQITECAEVEVATEEESAEFLFHMGEAEEAYEIAGLEFDGNNNVAVGPKSRRENRPKGCEFADTVVAAEGLKIGARDGQGCGLG